VVADGSGLWNMISSTWYRWLQLFYGHFKLLQKHLATPDHWNFNLLDFTWILHSQGTWQHVQQQKYCSYMIGILMLKVVF
jgi:hypothetical protein